MQTKINAFFKPQNPNQSSSRLTSLRNSDAIDAQSIDSSHPSVLATENTCDGGDRRGSASNIRYVEFENFCFSFYLAWYYSFI